MMIIATNSLFLFFCFCFLLLLFLQYYNFKNVNFETPNLMIFTNISEHNLRCPNITIYSTSGHQLHFFTCFLKKVNMRKSLVFPYLCQNENIETPTNAEIIMTALVGNYHISINNMSKYKSVINTANKLILF